ncbi:hypothetical protein HPB48_004966 [Haemaphysalis longicornis]|uniref:Kazal-like domain-containing protein n=1 Tax=Haemaphysalis longicornis TaxID=44386 RepID=A0A9J6GCL8_HAELO|nr:hypothetical protein HPB48_004966 [Haemaphysalis longicornis]
MPLRDHHPLWQEQELAVVAGEEPVGSEPDVLFAGTAVDTRCGIFSFRPRFLQPLCRPSVMLVNMSLVALMQSFITSGVMSVVLPTLERRFQLKSFESAMILSSYNVANGLAIAPVAFLGTSRNKPVFVAGGAAATGVGMLLFASAHFLGPPYQWGSEIQDLCPASPLPGDLCLQGNVRNYRFLLMAAHALNGMGTTPFYTLGVTYLDENVPTRKVSTHLGFFSAMGVLGPGLGFITAGFFLSIYVDVSRSVKHLGLTSSSAVWVGAWWVGFIISGVAFLILCWPMLLFPKHMTSYYELIEQKRRESRPRSIPMKDASIREMPKAILGVLSNATFMSLCLAGSADCAMAIVGGCGGTYLGGYLVTRFNMSCEAIIKLCLGFSFLPWLCTFAFRTYCADPLFAVNIPSMLNDSNPFEFPCNRHCGCNLGVYNPICTMDGTVFFSPCFAGCEVQLAAGGARLYTNCSCVSTSVSTKLKDGSVFNMQAQRKKCDTRCQLLPFFTIGMFMALLATFVNAAPLASVLLRVVGVKERSLALAVEWMLVRVVASIPGPLLFGNVIDRSCLVWQTMCGRSGSCLYYNNRQLAHNLFSLLILLKTIAILMYSVALLMYRKHFK